MTPNEIGRKISLLIDYTATETEARHVWSPMMMRELAELAAELRSMPQQEAVNTVDATWDDGPVPSKRDYRPPTLDARKARAEIATLLAKQKEQFVHTKHKISCIMSELSGDGRDATDD